MQISTDDESGSDSPKVKSRWNALLLLFALLPSDTKKNKFPGRFVECSLQTILENPPFAYGY